MRKFDVTTLNEFIIRNQSQYPNAQGGLSHLLHHVSFAARIVNREVNKAGLVDILGEMGTENIQGSNWKSAQGPRDWDIVLFNPFTLYGFALKW